MPVLYLSLGTEAVCNRSLNRSGTDRRGFEGVGRVSGEYTDRMGVRSGCVVYGGCGRGLCL